MSARELLDGLQAIDGATVSASGPSGAPEAFVLSGVEYAATDRSGERALRAAWSARRGGGATPLVMVADDPEHAGMVLAVGPVDGAGPLRRVRPAALLGAARESSGLKPLSAVRHVAAELERLDTAGVAGLVVNGLGTEHLFATRLPAQQERWQELSAAAGGLAGRPWKELFAQAGYELRALEEYGHLLLHGGRSVAVVHPKRSPGDFARLDAEGRLPEGALVAAAHRHGVAFGVMAAGTRLRLMLTDRRESGTTQRYLDLDSASIEPERLPLLGLLSPPWLAGGGLAELLEEGRAYGRALRERLDRVLRQHVLPVLGVELGRWARDDGLDPADDRVREELESAALTFVFRALFLLYAESAGHLPMRHPVYAERSMSAVCARATDEADTADPRSTSLWRDVGGLVEAMRFGQRAWGVPAYNGDLFASDGFAGAAILARASITDAALAPALVALARDSEAPDVGVDFSGLEIGHLGHIYEGLLSLRLAVADRDMAYDADADRYVTADAPEADVRAGDLLWLTDEGGRKGGGVYYTRTELVRHLVRGAVGPAFERHLEEVRSLAATDPDAAAERLFEFHVLDPACGSAHFLVEVLAELADRAASFLAEVPLPGVRRALDRLRAGAGAGFGAAIEDAALLRRLVLKRCVYGVDLSPMGAEIAKVSLWLAGFVPGLSLAYLDHNIQVGNSLVGVVRADEVARGEGQGTLFDHDISAAIAAAAVAAAELRLIDDRTPDEVARSRQADTALRERVHGARRVFDLWVAEPLGVEGAREEALQRGAAILDSQPSLLADRAAEVAAAARALHWPLAFAEVFARPMRPGFDVVVGNPPWEEITVEELAFYARYRPGLRALAEGPRRAALDALLEERPELVDRFTAERARIERLRGYFSAASGYRGGAGDPDTYKYFCQRYRHLLRDGGALGVVLPRSAFSAKGSHDFRRWLFDETTPVRTDFLLNSARWAFEMEQRYTVSLLLAERRPPAAGEPLRVAGVAASADAFDRQVAGPGLAVAREALGPLLEVPLLPDQDAADLLGRLRAGAPFATGGGRWRCFPVAEFHETADRTLWAGATEGRPLWKGESFDRYHPHGAGARPCPDSPAARAKALKKRPGAGSRVAAVSSAAERVAAVARTVERARVAFRDVSRATDSRTARACLVPPRHFLTNKAPYLAFIDDDPVAEAACLAVMNSLPFDWQARRFVETNMNFFVLEGLRVPQLEDDDVDALASAAGRLSALDDRFAEFAAALGIDCGPLPPAERTALEVEVDALVARAWGLATDDLDVIFADFTRDAVAPAYRERLTARLAELVS